MHPTPAAERAIVSDASLVGAALAGDRPAFGELVRRYERAARAMCLATLRDEHLASDAAQEAFVAAFRKLSRLRDRAAFAPWLLTICRNEAARAAGRMKKESPLPPSLASNDRAGPDHSALLAAVAALPVQERTVVMLRYFDGRDVAEIAAMLGRPAGTVTKQLSRAYERLRTERL